MSTSLSRSFDSEDEAKEAKASYDSVQYSTSQISHNVETNKYSFTVTVWSLD